MSYILKEWSVVEAPSSPYMAPEQRRRGVAGKVYGNPNFEDGSPVITSSVVEVNGRSFKTKTGSEYVLEGEPAKEYVEYLAAIGHEPLDPENPLKVSK